MVAAAKLFCRALLFVALLASLPIGPVIAQQTMQIAATAEIRELLGQAESLLAASDSQSAYDLLRPREAELAGHAYFDYLLGVAALDSGRIGEAILSLRRSATAAPQFSGARMELARAHFDAGEANLARPLFLALALARAIGPGEAEGLLDTLQRMHRAGSNSVTAIRAAASDLDTILARLESRLTPANLQGRERQILEEVLSTGAEGNYLDYVSAEQAFMAVQMLVIELDDPDLEAELDELANSLNNDERYRPAQFRRLLISLQGE